MIDKNSLGESGQSKREKLTGFINWPNMGNADKEYAYQERYLGHCVCRTLAFTQT